MPKEMPSGWMGEESQLLHTLRTFGADVDEEGKFLIYDKPVIKGLDGSVVVHQNTKCTIKGQPTSVAHLLHQTSYGVKVVVI